MLRVLRIIQSSSFAEELLSEQFDIMNWTALLLDSVWQYQQPDGYLLNYMDLDPSATFIDASGTALLAAATFRLAAIAPELVDTDPAERARNWIGSNIDADGWLTNVVNPLNWHAAGSHSPEGQAFVLMLVAAHRDYCQRLK
jgi:rhamnogalacturonyl hydrolase YesR